MIPRGTTPTNIFNLDADLRLAEVIYITYQQNGTTVLEKTKDDLTVGENQITVALTQEETLFFSDKSNIRIQIRARFSNGSAIKSNVIVTNTDELLKEGVI